MMTIFKSKSIQAGALFLILMMFVHRYLWNDQFIPVHDFTGGGRLFDLKQAVLDGHLPPRWAQHFGFGFGMPLFQFYAPLFFYFTGLFYLLNISIITSLKIGILIATTLGFWGMYRLGQRLADHWGGLLAATAYTVAPYHAVNLFVRGAFAEYLALGLYPWLYYWGLILLETKSIKAFFWLTLSISGLLLTHNVSTLTLLPFWLGFIAVYGIISRRAKRIFLTGLALIQAGLVSAFFLIPAFVQTGYTRVSEITGGFSYYYIHFLYFRQLLVPNWKYGGSILGIEDDMSFYLGYEILILALGSGVGLLLLGFKAEQKKPWALIPRWFQRFTFKRAKPGSELIISQTQFYGVFLGLFLLSLFLTNFKSHFIWQQIPLLPYVQFPWRFLGVASFLLALLVGYGGLLVKTRTWLGWVLILIISFNLRFFKPQKLIDPGAHYQPDPNYVERHLSGILPDYLPPQIKWDQLQPVKSVYQWVDGGGQVDIIKNTTDEIELAIETTTDSLIQINRFEFPNWRFKLDANPMSCEVQDYVYRCSVPAGTHRLTMVWTEAGINQWSNLISLIAGGVLVIAGILAFRKGRN